MSTEIIAFFKPADPLPHWLYKPAPALSVPRFDLPHRKAEAAQTSACLDFLSQYGDLH